MPNFLEGKKTYITALAMAVGVFLYKLGYISQGTLEWVVGIGGPLGATFIRSAIEGNKQ